MSLKSVYEKIKQLEDTPGSNDKKVLLKTFLKNGLFRRVVWCALTGTLHYKISAFPEYRQYVFVKRENDEIFAHLEYLSKKRGANDSDKEKLFQIASEDPETFEVVRRICNKDLRCGAKAKTINQVRPGTVKYMPYQRCRTSKHIDNIKFDESTEKLPMVVAEVKADGAFTNVFIDDCMNITFRTRSGEYIGMLDHLKEKMKESAPKPPLTGSRGIDNMSHPDHVSNKVFLGEFRVWEPGYKRLMSRKRGNGIIAKCRLGTATQDEAKRVMLTVWDSVPIEEFWKGQSTKGLRDRRFDASVLVNEVDDKRYCRFIEQYYPKDYADAMLWYRLQRENEEEGIVIKNLDFKWKDCSSGDPNMIKVTHVFECDLIIVGWNKGKKGKKNEDIMGSVDCESSCGKLKCNIGIGFTQEEREWDWDMLVGEILTTEAKETITGEKSDTYALYSASFVEVREEKDTANSLVEILEIESESKKNKRRK